MVKLMTSKKGMIATISVAMAVAVVAVTLLISGVTADSPVASKINYQGQLRDSFGDPLDGSYDMEFLFWNALVGGSQVGSTITKSGVGVTGGLFSVQLEVDSSDFNGQALWLEVKVEGETLGPRQEILPVPYALYVNPPACVRYDVSGAPGEYVVDVPSFAVDGICEILMWWHNVPFGAFSPGFLWPVQYLQNSSDDSWIGGPSVSLAGVSFSAGAGVNGNGTAQAVCAGGVYGNAYVMLMDDGTLEASSSQWTIDFNPEVSSFYGTLTIDGSPAPAGTSVEARCEGVIAEVTGNPVVTTVSGTYGSSDPDPSAKFFIQGPIADDEEIKFYVNDYEADQTAQWTAGVQTELNLTLTTPAPSIPAYTAPTEEDSHFTQASYYIYPLCRVTNP